MHEYHVDAYRYLRDHAKPVTERDAADLAAIRAPQPPSKAHLKRLEKHRLGRTFVENPRQYVEKPGTSNARAQNEWYKEQMALLGGSRTVAPAPEPVKKPHTYVVYVPKANSEPNYREAYLAKERVHLVRLAKMYKPHDVEPDMFRILEAFGSLEEYNEAVSQAHG